MYVLTVRRPWSWAIIHGGKNIENRSWGPPKKIIGQRIAIHAGKSNDWTPELAKRVYELTGVDLPEISETGIIGTVKIVGITWEAISIWCERGSKFWWILEDPEPFDKPIQAKGRLGLWRYDF